MKTLAQARYVSAPPSAGEWKLDTQGRTRPRGALDSEGAAQCLDAVFQPDEPRTPDRVSPADPVVTDAEPEGTLHRLHLDIYDRSVRVLDRIGERLRDHVVGRDLDPFRQPRLSPHVELDGNRAAARERLQRRPEAAFSQDGGMDAARHLPQLIKHVREP